MSDLIDRQKAINSVHSSVKFWDDGDVNYLIELIVACLQELPSAEKQGHWIESDTDGFVCSECRNGYRDQPTLMGKPMFEYCPVCGAKMDEVEEDG